MPAWASPTLGTGRETRPRRCPLGLRWGRASTRCWRASRAGCSAGRRGAGDSTCSWRAGSTSPGIRGTGGTSSTCRRTSHKITMRVTGDSETGRLLGMQLFGHKNAEVAKRIDIAATAIFHRMTVDAVSDLDLSYTPPLGSPWEAVKMGTQAWV